MSGMGSLMDAANASVGVSDRPFITMFMLMSVDGKISTGPTDDFDFDRDIPRMPGVMEGLRQYYDIEKTTDEWCCISGRTAVKVAPENWFDISDETIPCNIILFDNTHLTENVVRYYCSRYRKVLIVSSNEDHIVPNIINSNAPDTDNLLFWYTRKDNMRTTVTNLKKIFGIDRITLQGGGLLNYSFLESKCVDVIDLVVAPMIVGGVQVPSLVNKCMTDSLHNLYKIVKLKDPRVSVLRNSYIRLKYNVSKS